MNNQKRKVAIFDLDGTLINHHLWLGIIKYRLRTKENLFWSLWYLASHLPSLFLWKFRLISREKFYRVWGKDLSIMMRGLKAERPKEIFNWLCDRYLLSSLKKDIFDRLKKHQRQGFLTILISGSFQDLVDIIAQRLEIDFAIGTELEKIKGRFSGRIISPLCFGKEKTQRVKSLIKQEKLKINFKESFSYSDSIFDLPILEIVGNPIAVSPDKELFGLAKTQNWQII